MGFINDVVLEKRSVHDVDGWFFKTWHRFFRMEGLVMGATGPSIAARCLRWMRFINSVINPAVSTKQIPSADFCFFWNLLFYRWFEVIFVLCAMLLETFNRFEASLDRRIFLLQSLWFLRGSFFKINIITGSSCIVLIWKTLCSLSWKS